MSPPVVQLVAAGRLYPGTQRLWTRTPAHRAFGPVNLELRHSERVVLLGRSGAGKSTLGRCIAALEQLTEGRLLFGEARLDVTRHGPGPSIQMVLQDSPTAMNPHWTISDILSEPFRLGCRPAHPSDLAESLHLVGLSQELLLRRPQQLSGGQRRRVLIARALAIPDLQLLILDEPLAGLDAASARAILSLTTELQASHRFALLLITHDLASVRDFADRVLVMADGSVVEERPGRTFLEAAEHMESRALIDAMLPEVGA